MPIEDEPRTDTTGPRHANPRATIIEEPLTPPPFSALSPKESAGILKSPCIQHRRPGSVLIWWIALWQGGRTFRSDNCQDFTSGLQALKLQGLKPPIMRREMSEPKPRPPNLQNVAAIFDRTVSEFALSCHRANHKIRGATGGTSLSAETDSDEDCRTIYHFQILGCD